MSKLIEHFNKNTFQNKRVFILAGGPSLTDFDFSPLKDEITIGINKSFLYFPTTINFSLDHTFYNSIKQNIELRLAFNNFGGLKIFDSSGYDEYSNNILTYSFSKEKFISFDIKEGIFSGTNSAFAAMMMCIACGCKEIYFLGLDMSVGKFKTHFHNGYKGVTKGSMNLNLQKFKREFNQFSGKLKELNIKIVNLNPLSELNCFEFDTLENVIHKPSTIGI